MGPVTASHLQTPQLSPVGATPAFTCGGASFTPAQSQHLHFQNQSLARRGLVSLPSSLALSDWLSLFQLHPLPSLVFFFPPSVLLLWQYQVVHSRVPRHTGELLIFVSARLNCSCLKHPSFQDPHCKLSGILENSASCLPSTSPSAQYRSSPSRAVPPTRSTPDHVAGHLLVYMAGLQSLWRIPIVLLV